MVRTHNGIVQNLRRFGLMTNKQIVSFEQMKRLISAQQSNIKKNNGISYECR